MKESVYFLPTIDIGPQLSLKHCFPTLFISPDYKSFVKKTIKAGKCRYKYG